MPTYEFKCLKCEKVKERFSIMSELDKLKQKMYHCDSLMGIVITADGGFFERSSFPKEAFEHADFAPKTFRDKKHLLDHCEEVGIRSRLLEDGDVP